MMVDIPTFYAGMVYGALSVLALYAGWRWLS